MIELTRLSWDSFFLNPDLIQTVETTPDTVIRLTNGETLIVRESAIEIRQKVLHFRRAIHQGCTGQVAAAPDDAGEYAAG
jgi:flagellar protein FlbD